MQHVSAKCDQPSYVKFVCFVLIGPDDGSSLLAETCSIILTAYNDVLPVGNLFVGSEDV
jgi:hypothetical protein